MKRQNPLNFCCQPAVRLCRQDLLGFCRQSARRSCQQAVPAELELNADIDGTESVAIFCANLLPIYWHTADSLLTGYV